ncbi:hypothetical protein F3K34_43875 [Streptomyces sp. LBUM 1486]|uniref:hypothetical protein n=1 Tax=Streptomyces scabiei TaxID=1930 RepID=UPI001B32A31F|nr:MULTISPECIES: hypothetical protein [Streptomyces]MBP5918727.1 hypothetical protein [Streptomyces sp. LBUM 1486]MDX3283062.1 hypothetical protein [Streptomyces scabiei]
MTTYALKHPDGRWIYHLPKPDTDAFKFETVTGAYADGQPMEKLHGDWWATGSEATRLTVTAQPRPRTVGYKLRDLSAESVRYPATLTTEVWDGRRDREGDTLWELYDSVQEDQGAVEHVYDGPVMVLEGREPPGPDERQWKAELPYALGSRPEYLHLFPGHIPGLRAHLHEAIKVMPRVRHCFDKGTDYTGLSVTLSLQFDEPRTTWRADTSRRTGKPLKTGRTVPVLVDRHLRLPVPESVPGETYEAALRNWDQQVEFWLSVVRDATVRACSACNGTGHVAHGSETYGTR